MRFDALVAGPRDGELVLLLHGFPQTASCWRPALDALGAAGYRAVAASQRGYSPGARPEGVAAYSVDELTADALAMAVALGRERFHLIGHDWGGTVAWSVAAQHPEALQSLTVLSTPHSAALREALKGARQRLQMSYIAIIRLPGAAEWLFDAAGGAILENALVASGLSREHARRDVADLRRVGPTGALNWYRAIGRGSRVAPAPIAVTTLHVWGDKDVAFTRAATELTAEHVTAPYHLVELAGGSHWIPDEHWDDIEDLVLEHLAGAAAG
jgi:pimeloyl-ACP methyl ester carboxylesterase